MRGSSPLTRGKRVRVATGHGVQGLIPAHAGKTSPSRVTTKHTWAHPRSRGENVSLVPPAMALTGSSPLTRGKRGRLPRAARTRGLIPAHAGKTLDAPHDLDGLGAHPRSRGENQLTVDPTIFDDGSSPLTRGKHPLNNFGQRLHGLIPAHAGKTRP